MESPCANIIPTCTMDNSRLLSKRSRKANAFTYSPKASCVKATRPFSNKFTTASAWPDWFRPLR